MRLSTSSTQSTPRIRSSSGRDEKLEGLRLFKARASFQTALLRARVSRAAHRLAHPRDIAHHDHRLDYVTPPSLPTPSESAILEYSIPHRDSLTVISQRRHRRRRGHHLRADLDSSASWVQVEQRSRPTTDEEYGEMAKILKMEIAFAVAKWEEMARMRMARLASAGSGMSGETLVEEEY
ncbi:unnamed protein product [Peniophora sp. CBMAI 1063]|nr:unnamed protein product [Peniophora sp. CBMAI 1063]